MLLYILPQYPLQSLTSVRPQHWQPECPSLLYSRRIFSPVGHHIISRFIHQFFSTKTKEGKTIQVFHVHCLNVVTKSWTISVNMFLCLHLFVPTCCCGCLSQRGAWRWNGTPHRRSPGSSWPGWCLEDSRRGADIESSLAHCWGWEHLNCVP